MHSLRLQFYAPDIATIEEDDREDAPDRPGSTDPEPQEDDSLEDE